MNIFIVFFVFILGTLFGSFLNVCIHRMPKKISIVKPRSHCPGCKHTIAWYDNIPLLSYILLRCKCRHCKRIIPFRYFLVEFITGSLFLFLFFQYAVSPNFFIFALLFSSLIVITFIDIDYKEIPDCISIPGIIIGLLLSALYPSLHANITAFGGLKSSLFGVLAGGASVFMVGVIGELIFKKEAMGGGDVKLMAMVGALIGWQFTLLTFFIIAPLLGSIVGIVIKIRTGESVIPYGPFLSVASFIALYWGNDILDWFLYLQGG